MNSRRALIALAACLLPALVLAADPSVAPSIESYQAHVGDRSLGMLAAIFGSANGIFGGDEDSSVNTMMLAFNVAVMAVGAAWFSYNIITATLQGSFDGEFLGRRYSSVWMPVRTVSGAGLLVPVWKGWNLAGLSMAFATSVGIGIGNTVWGGLNGEIVPALVAAPAMQPLSDLGRPILTSRICLANRWVDQARLKKANVDPAAAEYSVTWGTKPVSGANYAAILYGAQPAANGQSESTCGIVKVEFPRTDASDPDVQSVITSARTAMTAALQGLDSDIAQLVEPARTMDPDDPDAVKNLEATIRQALPGLVASRQAALDSAINGVVNAKNANASQHIKDLTAQYGWLAAGVTPMVAAVNGITTNQAAPKVKSDAPQTSPEPPTILDPGDVESNAALAEAGVSTYAATPTAPSGSCGISSIGSGLFKDCVEAPLIAKIKSAGIGSLLGATSTDPIIYSQQLGMRVLGMVGNMIAGLFLIIAALALAAALAPASSAAIIGAGINIFGMFMGLLLIPLAAFALQLAVYIPLMLTMAWIMAVGAWLVVVAESLIAATLWALVHLDPEGEGMGQRTAHGYLFLLNLLFRPSILVFTAFFAQRFCGVLGGFANDVMSQAVAKIVDANSDSLFQTLAMLGAGLWITTTLNIKIVGTAASLMTMVPNQIFSWIGGQFGSDFGNVASQAAGDAHAGGSVAAGAAGGAVSRLGSGSRGGGSNGTKGEDKPAPTGIDKAIERMSDTQPRSKPARPGSGATSRRGRGD